MLTTSVFKRNVHPASVRRGGHLANRLCSSSHGGVHHVLTKTLATKRLRNGSIHGNAAVNCYFNNAITLRLTHSNFRRGTFMPFRNTFSVPANRDCSGAAKRVLMFRNSTSRSMSLRDFTALNGALRTTGVPRRVIACDNTPRTFDMFNDSECSTHTSRHS